MAAGEELGRTLSPGAVVLLSGELGAGKTRLAAGIARGLGCREPVTSPSYSLINTYQASVPIHHLDCYRLSDPDDLEDLGIGELLEEGGILVVEWPNLGNEWWPVHAVRLSLRVLPDGSREITGEINAHN